MATQQEHRRRGISQLRNARANLREAGEFEAAQLLDAIANALEDGDETYWPQVRACADAFVAYVQDGPRWVEG